MDAYSSYIEGWQKRLCQERKALDQAAQKAQVQAQVCAKALVEEYGAERVYLIGSLTRGSGFHPRSDIDLAVAGIPPERYFAVLADIAERAGREVDLILLESATPALLECVANEGVLLYERTEIPAATSGY
ncbi:MAG: nucleotidyltransferase domain-containing protein [Candidatus Latescibacteria bacterium]|nr:nucleotidyltransferase domain-containing protein [Candidatus Latescibacterota bacterium]